MTLWSLSSVLITYSACPIHPNWVSSEFKVFNCWGKRDEAKCSILVIWKAWSTLCKVDVIIVAWAAIHHRQLLWELWRPLCRCYSSLFIHFSTMTPTESNILPSTKTSKHLNSVEKKSAKSRLSAYPFSTKGRDKFNAPKIDKTCLKWYTAPRIAIMCPKNRRKKRAPIDKMPQVWSFWRWSLVEILRLKIGQHFEPEV